MAVTLQVVGVQAAVAERRGWERGMEGGGGRGERERGNNRFDDTRDRSRAGGLG